MRFMAHQLKIMIKKRITSRGNISCSSQNDEIEGFTSNMSGDES